VYIEESESSAELFTFTFASRVCSDVESMKLPFHRVVVVRGISVRSRRRPCCPIQVAWGSEQTPAGTLAERCRHGAERARFYAL